MCPQDGVWRQRVLMEVSVTRRGSSCVDVLQALKGPDASMVSFH